MKTCEGCTKCCDGWLTGKVFEEEFYPGKPCKFVKEGSGCTIYSMRPKHPCQSFDCFWKLDESMPDRLHPNISNGIVHRQVLGGVNSVAITHTGQQISQELIDYMTDYAIKNETNLVVNSPSDSYVVCGSLSFKHLFELVKNKKVV